ncbi:nicotinamide riboside transporter PnuC [Mycobacterium aquaticum]|uniref:Nicotinamide mononucleotide transporter PnuC n=1 Tax=Mycobacterium aquaticum TaxID=1927124 RepID=A0A1X0ABA6_9MYCO|nr:nicotinamide riboside transporter PnuC [Mycobacterium aquaticum]ORA27292.1 nicotinamide mononucleotide transporter PnuC [Mycobacterium aquaticum]
MLDWLARVVQPLNATLFVLGGDAVSWAELLGFVTGGLCVALTVRRHIANFPVGIANCVFFLVLFASARLWADAGLQVLYIALGFAGWWQWLYGNTGRTPLVVTRARPDQIGWCIGVVVAGTAALTVILRAAHDSAPFLDALTTCLSLVAQWLLNGKYLQTWYFWIAADCIYVPLYLSRDLNLTAAIYVVFLALCLSGLQSWRKVRVS